MLNLRNTILVGAAIAGAMVVPSLASAQEITAFTTNELNLRDGPGTSYRIIATMPEGSEVKITYCSNSESWCFLEWQHRAGWASSRYLTTTAPQYAGGPQEPYYPPPEEFPQHPQYQQPQQLAPVQPPNQQIAVLPPQTQAPVFQQPHQQAPVVIMPQQQTPVVVMPHQQTPVVVMPQIPVYPMYSGYYWRWPSLWLGFWHR